jgi:hypothetical protein
MLGIVYERRSMGQEKRILAPIMNYVSAIKDPRIERNKLYPLE